MKKMLADSGNRGKSLATLMNHHLQMYRATPHCTTNETPFKLMFGREMKTRFDVLRKQTNVQHFEKTWKLNIGKKDNNFAVGEMVYARDYRDPDRQRWIKAKIVRRKCENIYECHAADLGMIVRRTHQIMKYAYDDYEDEGARGGDIETIVAVPDDEYLSAEDDDNPIPQTDQQQQAIGWCEFQTATSLRGRCAVARLIQAALAAT